MGEVSYIILIVLIMSRLVCLSKLRFGKFVSFEVSKGTVVINFLSTPPLDHVEAITVPLKPPAAGSLSSRFLDLEN